MTKPKTFDDIGIGELRPGATSRRWEPEEGIGKLNNRIHKESKFADDNKNLPFTFSKPSKLKSRPLVVQCDNCGNITTGTLHTVGIICIKCGKFSKVSEVKCDN